MATAYRTIRKWVEENPGLHPNLRKYFQRLNSVVTWPATTTTTTTVTTTTTTV